MAVLFLYPRSKEECKVSIWGWRKLNVNSWYFQEGINETQERAKSPVDFFFRETLVSDFLPCVCFSMTLTNVIFHFFLLT